MYGMGMGMGINQIKVSKSPTHPTPSMEKKLSTGPPAFLGGPWDRRINGRVTSQFTRKLLIYKENFGMKKNEWLYS